MKKAVFVLRAKETLEPIASHEVFRPDDLPLKGTSFLVKGEDRGYRVVDVDEDRYEAYGYAPLADIERLLARPDSTWTDLRGRILPPVELLDC